MDHLQSHFAYDLNRTLAEIRPDYSFNKSCQGSVPESIIAFLESTDTNTTCETQSLVFAES